MMKFISPQLILAFLVSLMLCLKYDSLANTERLQPNHQGDQPMQILYVNPHSGIDAEGRGNSAQPLRTLRFALMLAANGTEVHLEPGLYNTSSGETFPVRVPNGVKILGKAASAKIEGSGILGSRFFGNQNVTISAESNSMLSGVTVSNPKSRGTALWIESASGVIVSNSIFSTSLREGIFVTGNSSPYIVNNEFVGNDANGISILGTASGVIRANTFTKTGFGVAISEKSTPYVDGNTFIGNRNGIVSTDFSAPSITGNSFDSNTDYGIVVLPDARPLISRNSAKNNGIADLFAPKQILDNALDNNFSKTKIFIPTIQN